jgi:hypothetical protein
MEAISTYYIPEARKSPVIRRTSDPANSLSRRRGSSGRAKKPRDISSIFNTLLLQSPGYAEIASTLAKGHTYKAYIPPEVVKRLQAGSARLATRANGHFAANILDSKTGKIIANASLENVPPDLLASLSQLSTQQALSNISSQLEAIGEQLSAVLEGQHLDRIAEVKAGVELYEQAMAASEGPERQHLLGLAVQSLANGRSKLLESVDLKFVHGIPKGALAALFSMYRDIPREIDAKSRSALQSMWAIVQATKYMVKSHEQLGSPASAKICLDQVKTRINELQIQAGELMHWLPPGGKLHTGLATCSQELLPSANELQPDEYGITVEFIHPD